MENKINFSGYYELDFDKRSTYFKGDSYINHCKNWTFTPIKLNDGKIYMVDTFWGSFNNSFKIELSEDNVSQFNLIFDINKVKKIKENEQYHYNYDDVYRVRIGESGSSSISYFVSKELSKNVNRAIEIIDNKLKSIERHKGYLLKEKEEIIKTNSVSDYFSWN